MNILPSDIKTIPMEDIKNISLSTVTGDIEVLGTDEDQIRIEIYASKRLFINFFRKESIPVEELYEDLVYISKENETLRVGVRNNNFWRWDWLSFCQVAFRVFLPKTINSFIKTTVGEVLVNNMNSKHGIRAAVGDIKIANTQGEVRVRTTAGNIKVGNCAIKAEISTSGGNILVLNSKGEINGSSSGGNIKLDGFDGKLYMRTSGGNIRAYGVSGDFKTFTAGGNIKLAQVKGNIGASTKGGNISVQALSVNEYLWLETSGGNITAQLPLHQGLQLEADSTWINTPYLPNFQGIKKSSYISGILNGGGASVKLRASGGRIKILSPQKDPFHNFTQELKKKQYDWLQQLHVDKAPYTNTNTKAAADKTTQASEQPQPYYHPTNHTLKNSFKNAINRLNPRFLLYTLFFTTFFIYGLNSILYFSLELLNPTSLEADQNKAVFLANLTTGFACFISLLLFILFIERFFTRNCMKYLFLVILTYIILFLIQLSQKIMYYSFNDGERYWSHYWRIISFKAPESAANIHNNLYVFIPMVVVTVFFYNWQRSKNLNRKISEQEYQLLNLEKLKTKAQLNALEARINPHFLYNSLNSITGLIHDNPDKAEEMTIQLSKLFRATTGRSDQSFHTIAEELEIVKSYLSIEQMRFGDRLNYAINLETGLENIKIPRFLLQPLVENAIKHGISKITEHGTIEVNITKTDDLIAFQIHDNGPAFKEDLSGGYGLKSISDKLQLIYGDKASLQIQNNGHKAVVIRVPAETSEKTTA
ncbi:histidine kinase [Emticicia sp. 17c]|uniref:histidine kinase n=1 Tax=Emticicia sp. 17c TaxID=3127704 RepID=UPI00301D72C1